MKTTLIVIIVIVVIVLVALVLLMRQRQQTQRIQQKFGPEYDRTVEQAGGRKEAEKELQERTKRREELQIRPLDPGAREEYSQQWRQTQERFVDNPQLSVREADLLVARVMQDRGYPVGDFEQRARDVSVDHSSVVSEYRAAHDISTLNDREGATTEQLREAMVHYRALFSELLEGDTGGDRAHA